MRIFPSVRHPSGRLPDNNDSALKYYELILENNHPENFRSLPLPEGFHFTTYEPRDEEAWISIETSAREFVTRKEGLEAWQRYYGGREKELPGRMFFIETKAGNKVATATAYYEPADSSKAGWLHWVAVRREYQGRGLARPLIAQALTRLAQLGYSSVKIPTQTNTWLAASLYLDFGFHPFGPNREENMEGYRILKTLTNHPALKDIEPADPADLWDMENVRMEEILRKEHPDLIHYKVWKEKGMLSYLTKAGDFEADIKEFLFFHGSEKRI
ncbi:MAG TPA: GNAT family N-acetyltransferase [Candidatus Pullilachnospira intestinigallinarum]|nr:GNAT family N-acetyltransferase [Candidatus Pullilachnospira intestinigallinarum]